MSQAFETDSALDHFVRVEEFCEEHRLAPVKVEIDSRQDRPFLLTLDLVDFIEFVNRFDTSVDGQRIGSRGIYRASFYDFDIKAQGQVTDDIRFLDWD